MIISIGKDKALENIQHQFMIEAMKKLVIHDLYVNLIKAVYDRPIVNSVLNGENLKHFL
jgi:hypothetical protein